MESILKKIKKEYPFKRVVISSYEGFFDGNSHEDDLIITCEYLCYKKDENCVLYEYRIKSDIFEKQYENLCERLLYYNYKRRDSMLDASGFCIHLINFKDEEIDYYFDLTVNDQHDISLRNIANVILNLIPNGEPFPKCLKHQEISDIDINVAKQAIEDMKKNSKVEFIDGKEKTKDTKELIICYPSYPKWLHSLIDGAFLEIDTDWPINCEKYFKGEYPEELDVNKLSFEELKTLLTFFYRQERICEGNMSHYIRNGCLLKWLERLVHLYNDSLNLKETL